MQDWSTAAVTLRDVAKSWGPVPAVRGLSLEIPRGATVALFGPNGAGKSTTIAMLTGLVAPDAGTVRVWVDTRSAVRSGRIAVMLRDAGLMPGVTVVELLRLGYRRYPDPVPVDEMLDRTGLSTVAGWSRRGRRGSPRASPAASSASSPAAVRVRPASPTAWPR
jgi:ABC-2 type transport system ATP-binding protein